MKPTKLLLPILTAALLLALVGQSYADISNAAVLYLRIAPGARAAGMGEAYVAIADDATSTHWNPAGLGAYPLAPGWTQATIPNRLQPIKDIASLKSRSGSGNTDFDIWANTAMGLARYDGKKWYTYEEFDTKTDQTIRQIVASYFGLTDDGLIDAVAAKVALENNKATYEHLDSVASEVMAAIPESYDDYETMKVGFDSLRAAYNLCLINWDKVNELKKNFYDGNKDGTLDEKELDRIFFSLEKSRTRFIPERITIKYSALVDAEIVGLGSVGTFLVIGTEKGAYAFDGRRWQIFGTQNGMPSARVTSVGANRGTVLIGTDNGVIKYEGVDLLALGQPGELPSGDVTAVTPGPSGTAWAVVNGVLYHYDGTVWSDYYDYTVVIDDTPEKLAEKLTLYGSVPEKEKFIEALGKLNREPEDDPGAELVLEPGQVVRVPYTIAIKGDVNVMMADLYGRLWVGTSYGLAFFEDNRWNLPGYRDHVIADGETIDDLMKLPSSGAVLDKALYRAAIEDINELDPYNLPIGETIKLYRNPTGAPVTSISTRQGITYFATTAGLVEYDGVVFDNAEIGQLKSSGVVNVESYGNELWFAGNRKVVSKANSKTDISMMYVKWLPELADDLYYAFASVTSHWDGVGTIGGNFTYISYGTMTRTGETGLEEGTFESFDLALTGSWGTSITDKLKTGISAKLLYSKLADQGAGGEQGEGTSTGFAVDFGFLYQLNKRTSFGLAVTNLGPDMAYIDAAQSDPLPRNLAIGAAYKLLQTDYYHLLLTTEVNKSLVGVDDKFRDELEQLVLNGGGEFLYANLLALRAGYIYDQEGDIKTATLGVGIGPVGIFKFDFSYIPSNNDVALENTLRISLAIQP